MFQAPRLGAPLLASGLLPGPPGAAHSLPCSEARWRAARLSLQEPLGTLQVGLLPRQLHLGQHPLLLPRVLLDILIFVDCRLPGLPGLGLRVSPRRADWVGDSSQCPGD